MKYLLTEDLIHTLAVYMILKRIMLPFVDWDAHKLGIIDKNGKKLKHPVSSKELQSWDMLTRFCWNLKKITSKYIGKGKLAQNFVGAWLLKDSINDYIITNQQKLNESLLYDMTFKKQELLYNSLQELSKHNNLATPIHNNLVDPQHENIVDFNIQKMLPIVENLFVSYPELINMFEDESGATVCADIAQHSDRLGAMKRENPNKFVKKDLTKLKKKRKLQNESN
jgi:hypothetical protein